MATDERSRIEWHRLYNLSAQTQKIASMQTASLSPRGDAGLSVEPALVGSREWWDLVKDGRLPTYELEGTITNVYWGSMRDWPEFTLTASDGSASDWTREGDVRRYVVGLRGKVRFVRHPWKDQVAIRNAEQDIHLVLSIDVEESGRRSSGIAPGPFEDPDDPPSARCGLRVDNSVIFLPDVKLGKAEHAPEGAYELEIEILDAQRRGQLNRLLSREPGSNVSPEALSTATSLLLEYEEYLGRRTHAELHAQLALLTVETVQSLEYGFMVQGRCRLSLDHG